MKVLSKAPLIVAIFIVVSLCGSTTEKQTHKTVSPKSEPQIIKSISPKQMVDLLKSEGFITARIIEGEEVGKVIIVKMRGHEVLIFCSDDNNLISFWSQGSGDVPGLGKTNEWNKYHHFTSAWVKDDDEIVLTMRVILKGGVTRENIAFCIHQYSESMEEFWRTFA